MAYVLILIGILLTVSGVRDTHKQLFTLVENDFTGSNSFIFWLAAIAIVGALGYVPALKGFSTAFLTLLLIVLVLAKSGKGGNDLFGKFSEALQQSTVPKTGTNP